MKVFVKIIVAILIFCISIMIFVVGSGYDMYKKALEQQDLASKVEQIRENPNYTTIDKLPKTYKDAVIAFEDHRFYEHNGIDIISIGRAIINDIKAMELVEGGSTITQQLSKNIYFSQDKNFIRKIAEVFMALKIEQNYSKDQILELYLNTNYFGDGYYCVKEASEGYFGKTPDKMTDYESTMLAGIPNAPSVYAPTQNIDLTKQIQKIVVNKMIEYEFITNQKAQTILNLY